MKKILSTFFFALAIVLPMTQGMAKESSRLEFPTTRLTIGSQSIQVEVAESDEQRQQGLMSRKLLGINKGMLFVFGEPVRACMWMKNTTIPLSVAFIDHAGRIINIEDMMPQTTESHCGKGLVWYALEMNQGWFTKNEIQPGTQINGLP